MSTSLVGPARLATCLPPRFKVFGTPLPQPLRPTTLHSVASGSDATEHIPGPLAIIGFSWLRTIGCRGAFLRVRLIMWLGPSACSYCMLYRYYHYGHGFYSTRGVIKPEKEGQVVKVFSNNFKELQLASSDSWTSTLECSNPLEGCEYGLQGNYALDSFRPNDPEDPEDSNSLGDGPDASNAFSVPSDALDQSLKLRVTLQLNRRAPLDDSMYNGWKCCQLTATTTSDITPSQTCTTGLYEWTCYPYRGVATHMRGRVD